MSIDPLKVQSAEFDRDTGKITLFCSKGLLLWQSVGTWQHYCAIVHKWQVEKLKSSKK